MTAWRHERRLAAVAEVVRASGARTLLDLGCGDGDLLVRLVAEPGIERIVGVDLCRDALGRLQERLAALKGQTTIQVDLVHGSITEGGAALGGFDCAVLVETIEHTDPERLSLLERALFGLMRPKCVVITTPNADFNPRLGVPAHRGMRVDHGADRLERLLGPALLDEPDRRIDDHHRQDDERVREVTDRRCERAGTQQHVNQQVVELCEEAQQCIAPRSLGRRLAPNRASRRAASSSVRPDGAV